MIPVEPLLELALLLEEELAPVVDDDVEVVECELPEELAFAEACPEDDDPLVWLPCPLLEEPALAEDA